ncbi:up-regulator of cell proliferation [Xenopus tropicalis]|uniref:Up-regulator of cell proliferation n=1 Tax=Xenopus tropicalis TaxID=8364 RepID=A0A8J0QT35_XENTR|nr:up-regulator of cell proliferation [Xenopus tropicalis]
MEPTGEASHTINHLKSKLTDIFVNKVDDLVHEVESITENDKVLYEAEDPVEQVQQILDHVLQRGESDWQLFLGHLQKMAPRFPGLMELLESEKKRNILTEMIKQHKTSKLTLRDIQNIGRENLNECDPLTVQDLPWILLRKLAALNRSARNVSITQTPRADAENPMMDLFDLLTCNAQDENSDLFNPFDILCVLLNCSDNILQQNILSKMSLCQFALPLLLPAGDVPNCTFKLWAMRDIVKCWTPHTLAEKKGFKEESLVHIELPLFSFVRLEKSKISKSKILNQVLSPRQQYQDFFIHGNMEGGNHMRYISNGLVEIAWYFPTGRKNLDIFEEPIALTNLRGDIEGNETQFSFLTQVSAAVFVFAEEINEREFRLLTQYGKSNTIVYFIITQSNKTLCKETVEYLKKLLSELNIDKGNVLIKGRNDNDTNLVQSIQKIIKRLLNTCRKIKLEEASHTASKLKINVDENFRECQKAKMYATEITEEIKDVVQYKKETIQLQGDLWKQVAQIEKELCRMRKLGGKNTEEYRSQLIDQCFELHRKQNKHDLPGGVLKFINAIAHLSQEERHYFLKWMKFALDSLSRNTLSKLKAEYRLKCTPKAENIQDNGNELKLIDQQISDSSLGVEHFLRVMGQFYEAECSIVKQGKIKPDERQFSKLPGIAADLLLDGFPLELIDGDASNIPLQWITDVLADLNNKTGGKCRMRVITVLGVQSTGKSTLLNTMFGLQFPVSSGRCTRGAFMTLIKVKEDFQEHLGCELIVVIDTEGLKAQHLYSLEDSNEHDNELATLVVGLSDITIINMAMENTAEMTDILQISIHAFLRMNKIEKKPKCQFVHQNVSDVSANDNNMRDKSKLLTQLDKMTKVAATMEKKSGITHFSDIMVYDLEKDNWYIPGLWNGAPPMASVDAGYSDHIHELKKYLFELMAQNKSINHPQNIGEFIEWIKSLWKSVKYENFIFNFRNTLVAEAYEQLSVKYSEWEWDFRKKVHTWLLKTETIIKNHPTDRLQANYLHDLHSVLGEEEKRVRNLLDTYFDSRSENAHLIERYREEFSKCVLCLRNELENSVTTKIDEVIQIQKGKYKLEGIKNTYQKTIEEKVTCLLEEVRQNEHQFSNAKVRQVFEDMWENTLSDLQRIGLDKRNISQEMFLELYRDMNKRGSFITKRVLSVTSLGDFGECEFEVKEKHVDLKQDSEKDKEQNIIKIKDFASFIIRMCSDYVTEKIGTRDDYHGTYCLELLNIISDGLREEEVKSNHITHEFALDLKLHILGQAAPRFQKLHNDFIQKNDPVLCMGKLKLGYLATFESIYQEKDESQSRARQFYELCLKPAITNYVNQRLGLDIVEAIIYSGATKEFSSRTFFQFTVLEKLLKDKEVMSFVQYINEYEIFVKKWIQKYILDTYKDPKPLRDMKANILTNIHKEILTVLRDKDILKFSTVSDFLECFCGRLNNKLVIPQHEMNLIIFENKANIEQFAKDIEFFLQDIENHIIADFSSIESILGKVTVKPEDELFKRVFGCGKQCPFCKVPCEAGGTDHKEHFASVHRPQGLIGGIHIAGIKLNTEICSSAVIADKKFVNVATNCTLHPYKEYRSVYPDWAIQPDASITASDYWKYIFVQFNKEFASIYEANPADLPDLWCRITEEMAFQSLKESFNIK